MVISVFDVVEKKGKNSCDKHFLFFPDYFRQDYLWTLKCRPFTHYQNIVLIRTVIDRKGKNATTCIYLT